MSFEIKLLPTELLNKLYDDAISGSAKQIGKIGEDALKATRLILAPLQAAAALQNRFEGMMERLARRVPDERRVEPPVEIVGPTVQFLRYVGDDGPLWSMFEEVLAKSIDTAARELIHPSFPQLIAQLSRDEAWMLYRLREQDFEVIDELDYDRSMNRFVNRVVKSSKLPEDELFQPTQINLYYTHLDALGLVQWHVEDQTPIFDNGIQSGVTRRSRMTLTDFGRLFVGACTPMNGFERFRKV